MPPGWFARRRERKRLAREQKAAELEQYNDQPEDAVSEKKSSKKGSGSPKGSVGKVNSKGESSPKRNRSPKGSKKGKNKDRSSSPVQVKFRESSDASEEEEEKEEDKSSIRSVTRITVGRETQTSPVVVEKTTYIVEGAQDIYQQQRPVSNLSTSPCAVTVENRYHRPIQLSVQKAVKNEREEVSTHLDTRKMDDAYMVNVGSKTVDKNDVQIFTYAPTCDRCKNRKKARAKQKYRRGPPMGGLPMAMGGPSRCGGYQMNFTVPPCQGPPPPPPQPPVLIAYPPPYYGNGGYGGQWGGYQNYAQEESSEDSGADSVVVDDKNVRVNVRLL